MTPQQIAQGEYDITVINEVFAKVFNTDISAKFQKFVNDWRTGVTEIKSKDFEELKGLLRDYNTKKINQNAFVEKVNICLNPYF